ncbi:hypothetical protein RAD15_13195, partial [Bradyrhizobium sp. 14AA]
YCIVVRHGADLHSCPGTLADVQDRVESTPCALSNNFEPDSRGSDPGIHRNENGGPKARRFCLCLLVVSVSQRGSSAFPSAYNSDENRASILEFRGWL